MSMRQQTALLSLNRSGLYYYPKGESDYNHELMGLIDEEFTKHPFKGVGQMTTYLRRFHGKICGPKRVRRLIRLMGLEPIYPKPKTTISNPQHVIFPYLLRDIAIEHVNQVWSTDITYIRLKHGFVYLVAIMDWYSRAVLSWRLSNTMDTSFCCDALNEALKKYGSPDIFNTDQGSQFTSQAFITGLKGKGISISMDGRGRALDNVFVERLWRTVKYEEVYIKGYETILDAQKGLEEYFQFYNHDRYHSSLNDQTPWEVFYGVKKQKIA